MQGWVEQTAKGLDDILRCEWSPVRESHALAQGERYPFSVLGDLPCRSQFGLGLLRQAVDADQDAFGQVAERLGRFVGGEERIERLRIVVQREAKFAAGISSERHGADEQHNEKRRFIPNSPHAAG